MTQEYNLTLQSSDLVEMGHSAILVHHKGVILYANPYAANKVGFSNVDDFIGLSIRDFIHPDDLPKIIARIEDMYANGTHYDDLDERFLDKNGRTIYVDASVKPINYEGKPSILMVANDITHHKEAKFFTEQTSHILSMVASGSAASEVYDAICMMHESKYPHMRSSILRLQGQQLFHCASPSLPQAYSQAIDGVKIGPSVGSCGTAAFLGKEIIVENIATDPLWSAFKDVALPHNLWACWSEPIMGIDGSILGTFAMYFDRPTTPSEEQFNDIRSASKLISIVMERDRRESSLRQSENQYRTLVENLPQRFFLKDTNSVFISCSKNLAEDLGITTEEIIGTTDYDYFSKELAAHYQEDDQRIMQSKKAKDIEETITIGGEERIIHTVKAPALDEHGNVEGILGYYSDITEVKELEEKFNQAHKMEAVGTLVGGIAHDFNNMLAAITGNIYLAKNAAKDMPKIINRLEKIEDVSLRAANMISQLLTFSRKGIVSIKEIPLTAFLKETLKFIRSSLPENIAMHKNICAEHLTVKGDMTQLYQVLINLINNARDAVENVQNPRITINLEAFQADDTMIEHHQNFKAGAYAHLSVEDNGYGIPKQMMEHIFEPFFTTKEQGKGTGLGLSMIFGALKTHQGFITIDSIENKGSTFHIYIPLLEEEATAILPSQEDEPVEGSGELILLADDEQDLRETTAEVLDVLGYRVLQATDGLEAMALYKAHQDEIAILLLDVVMPNMGGVQLAEDIRALKSNVPIIFMTGYDKEHVLGTNTQITNSQVLTKPVQFSALNHSIQLFLDKTES